MQDFQKVLVTPNIEALDLNTQRIRRNLMMASVLIFIFFIASDGVNTVSASFAGIKFLNLKPNYLEIILLSSHLYFLLHFIWAAHDHLKSNLIRLTGVAVPKINEVGGFESSDKLYANTDDNNQTSLYSWWCAFSKKPLNINEQLKTIREKIEKNSHGEAIQHIEAQLRDIKNKTDYINEALLRFDLGFWRYQRSQILRWILLDFGVPVFNGYHIL